MTGEHRPPSAVDGAGNTGRRWQDKTAPELQASGQRGDRRALWGGLIGLVFFMPLLGMAIGGATSATTGAMTDVGVDDAFMQDLGEKLKPGGAAVFVLVRQSTQDALRVRATA